MSVTFGNTYKKKVFHKTAVNPERVTEYSPGC